MLLNTRKSDLLKMLLFKYLRKLNESEGTGRDGHPFIHQLSCPKTVHCSLPFYSHKINAVTFTHHQLPVGLCLYDNVYMLGEIVEIVFENIVKICKNKYKRFIMHASAVADNVTCCQWYLCT